jgi:hypothetical protein
MEISKAEKLPLNWWLCTLKNKYKLSIINPKIWNRKCYKIENFLSTDVTPRVEDSRPENFASCTVMKMLHKIAFRLYV